jgi:small-conductance mechanosensitive channel
MQLSESEWTDYRSKKGSDRIQINNILCAVCVAALSVLLGISRSKLSSWTIGQLAIAIPLLVTSSLCYAKVGYRSSDEARRWDTFGWLTHSLGYAAVLNATGTMLYRSGFRQVTWVFVAVVLSLFLIYSFVDVHAKRHRLNEKVLKLLFYLALLFVGLVLPILAGWV